MRDLNMASGEKSYSAKNSDDKVEKNKQTGSLIRGYH